MIQRLIALNAIIESGAFSGEILFDVLLANGERYQSIAPRQFCWDSDNQYLVGNSFIGNRNGMIAARIIDIIDAYQVLVEVPDGNVITVALDDIKKRPTKIEPPIYRLKSL
jgi:hypothetical protein